MVHSYDAFPPYDWLIEIPCPRSAPVFPGLVTHTGVQNCLFFLCGKKTRLISLDLEHCFSVSPKDTLTETETSAVAGIEPVTSRLWDGLRNPPGSLYHSPFYDPSILMVNTDKTRTRSSYQHSCKAKWIPYVILRCYIDKYISTFIPKSFEQPGVYEASLSSPPPLSTISYLPVRTTNSN